MILTALNNLAEAMSLTAGTSILETLNNIASYYAGETVTADSIAAALQVIATNYTTADTETNTDTDTNTNTDIPAEP